eukprot:GHVL01019048.1.p1 GENE.GHVL01019048.1~~GHVL01019048.1.p1  ORF type:complete len:576 (-),score=68.54 GHVL01019048.1:1272-2999(-)
MAFTFSQEMHQLKTNLKRFHYLFLSKNPIDMLNIVDSILPHIRLCSPSEVAMIAHHCSQVNHKNKVFWNLIATEFPSQNLNGEMRDLATMISSFSKIEFKHEGFLKYVCAKAMEVAIDGPFLSTIIGGLDNLKFVDTNFMQRSSIILQNSLSQCNEVDLSVIAAAYSNAKLVDVELFRAISQELLRVKDRLTEKHIAMISRAFATQHLRDESTLNLLGHRLYVIASDDGTCTNPDCFPQILTSFANLRYSMTEIQYLVDRDVPRSICNYRPQDLYQILYSLRYMKTGKEETIRAVIQELTYKLDKLPEKKLFKLASIAGDINYKLGQPFWEKTINKVCHVLNNLGSNLKLDSNDIMGALVAFSKIEKQLPINNEAIKECFKTSSKIIPDIIMSFSPENLSQLAQILGSPCFHLPTQDLLTKIKQIAKRKMMHFKPVTLLDFLLRMKSINLHDDELMSSFGRHIVRNISKYTEQQLQRVADIYDGYKENLQLQTIISDYKNKENYERIKDTGEELSLTPIAPSTSNIKGTLSCQRLATSKPPGPPKPFILLDPKHRSRCKDDYAANHMGEGGAACS